MALQVKVVLRADVSGGTYDKVAIISGCETLHIFMPINLLFSYN